LPAGQLLARAAALSFGELGFDGLRELCRSSSAAHAPSARLAHDPRDGLPITYSEARATRPVGRSDGCAVCDDETCPACDVLQLPGAPSDAGPDLAWFSPNLYPIAYPFPRGAAGAPVLTGLHLVHWSSLRHADGLVGADRERAVATLGQLARAEEFLLHGAGPEWPASGAGDDGREHRGHCGLVKNRGRRVGGSVEHDHQQLLFTDQPFLQPSRTVTLAAALAAEAPAARIVDDVDGLALSVVPDFMHRPLHSFVVPLQPRGDGPRRATRCGWLHHLPAPTAAAFALALARLTAAVSEDMLRRGSEPAWNLLLHTGPGCAPLAELRPFTQPLGGYEHLGLYLCEELPETSAARLRDALPR